MLNVSRLRMLREVAARGTIAAAAEALFMTASAVSQQMAVLEREARVTLLERRGRGVRLTEAARLLVEDTERILAELEHAEARLAASATGVSGHVRVSAFPTASRAILVPALVALKGRYPGLRVETIDLEPEEAVPSLRGRDLDVAVTYEWDLLPSPAGAGIERERLLAEPVFIALPREHPLVSRQTAVAISDLADEPWIVGRDSTSMLDFVTTAARRSGFEPRTDFHSMDFDVILAAVGAGLGVALVPPMAIVSDRPDVVLRSPADMQLTRSVWMAIRRGSRGHPAIDAVMEGLSGAARHVAAGLE